MENTSTGFTNDIAPQPARPQFLATLCILTWVCVALLLVFSLIGLVMKPSPEKQAEQIEQIRAFNPEAADQMEAAMAEQGSTTQILSQVLNIIALGLSGYGAWMMWNLKKTGFYVYIAGEIIPYAGFMMGGQAAMAAVSSMGGAASAAMGIAITLMVIFDLAFIIMYAVNLKHMNK